MRRAGLGLVIVVSVGLGSLWRRGLVMLLYGLFIWWIGAGGTGLLLACFYILTCLNWLLGVEVVAISCCYWGR